MPVWYFFGSLKHADDTLQWSQSSPEEVVFVEDEITAIVMIELCI